MWNKTLTDSLLDAFKELHEEAQRITFFNKALRGHVRWHIEKFINLQKEVYDLRKQKAVLEKSINDSFCTCKSNNVASNSNCEGCKVLEN